MSKGKDITAIATERSVYGLLCTILNAKDESSPGNRPYLDSVAQGLADAIFKFSREHSGGLAETTAYNILDKVTKK